MLKKNNRLSRTEFSKYFKTGKRFHFDELTVVYSPAPTFLCAVVVSKKVSKGAVRRNTLKRRVYARLSKIQKEYVTMGVFIVILKPSFNSVTRAAADELVHKSIVEVLKNT
jgi:ribonuclease P protein component